MDERRYSQDEVAKIFERASETEAKLPATGAGAGLTLAEPTSAGSRIRLQTTNGNARIMMTMGIVFLGTGAASLIADTAAAGISTSAVVSGAGFMALVGSGAIAAGALRVSGWARQRAIQFDEIIARIVK